MPVPDETSRMIHPDIEPCLQVVASGKIGIFAGRIEISEISSSTFTVSKNSGKERLKLTIPYAGQSIEWIVIFDARNPHIPPDILFPDEDFVVSLDSNLLTVSVPTLFKWDKNDPKGLLNLIQEYLVLYRDYQLTKLINLPQKSHAGPNEASQLAKTNVQALVDSRWVSVDDLEIFVGHPDDDAINIAIRLAVDVSSLPSPTLQVFNENPVDDKAALLVNYVNSGRSTAQLYLTPKIEEVLGGSSNLLIPAFSKCDHLPTYMTNVKIIVENKIRSIGSNFRKRKEFLNMLLSQMGRAALEFDSANFTKASFLLEWNNFYFIVHACLPEDFPVGAPIYIFQSVYHTVNEKPFSSKCKDCPYNPKADIADTVLQVKAFILQYIETFQKSSILLKK